MKRTVSRRARPDEPLADWCEVRTEVCTGRAEHRHHKLRRSRGGSDDASNTADCCGRCHLFIHEHPAWAYAAGWLIRGAA